MREYLCNPPLVDPIPGDRERALASRSFGFRKRGFVPTRSSVCRTDSTLALRSTSLHRSPRLLSCRNPSPTATVMRSFNRWPSTAASSVFACPGVSGSTYRSVLICTVRIAVPTFIFGTLHFRFDVADAVAERGQVVRPTSLGSWARADRAPVCHSDPYFCGRAKTNSPLPPTGRSSSGISSAGIMPPQLPPPVPTGTARYCRPSTA